MNQETQVQLNDKYIFGFWIYLMTDLLVFAVLFAAYAVLGNNTFGGITIKEIFDPPYVLAETLILLTSSFTCGLAMLAVFRNQKNQTIFWFFITFLLGLSFLIMEIHEFRKLLAEGASFQTSAFLSSFFTLVGTHGLHITAGLLWIIISMLELWYRGLNPFVTSKLIRLSLFWHFLDIVWIFIFTFVYLIRV